MEWISVKDRLPPCEQEVLYTDGSNIYLGHLEPAYEGSKHSSPAYWTHYDLLEDHDITHWRVKPQLPVSEWVSAKERLPMIDYENKKSYCRVKIKINNNPDFVTTCSFREVFVSNQEGKFVRQGFEFYDSEKGRSYYGVTHWILLSES